jgi:hypothetical protein
MDGSQQEGVHDDTPVDMITTDATFDLQRKRGT